MLLRMRTGKKKTDASAPAAAGPRLSLLHVVEVDPAAVEALVAECRAYRRGVERTLREAIASAAARGVGVPPEDDRPDSPSKKGEVERGKGGDGKG